MANFKIFKEQLDFISKTIYFNKNTPVKVFSNPTFEDLSELRDNIDPDKNPLSLVRFTAVSKTKKLYVWDGLILHFQLNDQFKRLENIDVTDDLEILLPSFPIYYAGVCRLSPSNRLEYLNCDALSFIYFALNKKYPKLKKNGVDDRTKNLMYPNEVKNEVLGYSQDILKHSKQLLDRYRFIDNYIPNFSTETELADISKFQPNS